MSAKVQAESRRLQRAGLGAKEHPELPTWWSCLDPQNKILAARLRLKLHPLQLCGYEDYVCGKFGDYTLADSLAALDCHLPDAYEKLGEQSAMHKDQELGVDSDTGGLRGGPPRARTETRRRVSHGS